MLTLLQSDPHDVRTAPIKIAAAPIMVGHNGISFNADATSNDRMPSLQYQRRR